MKIKGLQYPRAIVVMVLTAALTCSCAGSLQPVDSPLEMTPQPAHAEIWKKLGKLRADAWFKVLNVGSEAFDWRLRAIDSATNSIDFQTFIWELDAAGSQVREHLLAAAERGVFVRVLMDDSFVLDADQELLKIDQHSNIELKVFNPYKRRSSNIALREILNLGEFHRLDHRMHNKVMVVDNQVAIVGGRNIATHYFGYHKTDNFRDMELVVGGPVVQKMAAGFDRYWNDRWAFPVAAIMHQRAGPGKPEPIVLSNNRGAKWHTEQTSEQRLTDWKTLEQSAYTGQVTLLLDKAPDRSPSNTDEAPVQVGQALVAAIDKAKTEVILISAYLIPTPELTAALQRAKNRGVQVKTLTNSINSTNHLTAHSAYRKHIKGLVKMGLEVYEVRSDAKDRDLYIQSPVADKSLTLHAKLMIIDNETVYVGSANLDPRSLRINTEMGLLITSPSLNQALRHNLEPDFSLRNAWHLQEDTSGQMTWVSDEEVLQHQPTSSFMHRIEDWFFTLLPIEGEM